MVPAVALKTKMVTDIWNMFTNHFPCIHLYMHRGKKTKHFINSCTLSLNNACFLHCQNLCKVLVTLVTLLLVIPFLVNVTSSLAKKSQNLTTAIA